jgi:peptidoglycan-associated lipoprotein
MLQIQRGLRYSAEHENSDEPADVGRRNMRRIAWDGKISICRLETRNTVARGINMNRRIVVVFGILLGLAACSSAEQPPPAGPGGPQPLGSPGGVGSRTAIPGSQQDLEASAGDRVFFAFDRSDISPEARETLTRQADWLRRYPNVTVTIEGHCDERGTREYNLALGERRAQAVKNVLVALGISASRISTISYGKERPAVAGSTEEAYAQNRRAVTTIN